MNLDLISFVGVDVKTDLHELLVEDTVPCEYGVLYSESKNSLRYPDYDFCIKFLSQIKDYSVYNSIYGSLHLCGSVIDKYLTGDQKIVKLASLAGRIQLNIDINKYSDYEKLSNDIINIASNNNHHIILQKNKTKMKFNEVFESKYNKKMFDLSLLNDSSGGFGREITKVLPPYEYYTGYAGGIKPENVCTIIKLIEKVCPENKAYYIDMESGIREDNVFSIAKCREIIKNVQSMT